MMKVRIRRLEGCRDLPLPGAASKGSSGLDLYACVDGTVDLAPGEAALIPSGISVEIPEGYEAQVRPRSGLAHRHCITVLNSPGTIDSDYRGEVGVILINHGKRTFSISRGDRIAQVVFSPVCRPALEEVDALQASERGDGGFGHTGV
jgi:dUTP pyrophosphatase